MGAQTSAAKSTRALSFSMPLTSYPQLVAPGASQYWKSHSGGEHEALSPHRRASLMAVSPPSTPVFIGRTRS
eukprot:927484-Rhodomonas_salina.1